MSVQEPEVKSTDLLRAQGVLELLLARHVGLIAAMRSFHQHLQMGIFDESVAKLRDLVRAESEGQLDCVWSSLVAVNVIGGEWQNHHDLSRFINGWEPPRYPEGFVKGFTFLVNDPTFPSEVLVLDPNKSREAFDRMGDREKDRFIELFGQRRRDSAIFINTEGLPTLYVVVAKEEDQNGYKIEKIRGVKPASPLPWQLARH